jgi:hypothetical protein
MMQQYKISFYRNRKYSAAAVYYREFDTLLEMKEWANDTLRNDSLYCRYEYILISVSEYLKNTQA